MSETRVVEVRDDKHKSWVRERSEYVGELRHGLRESFSVQGKVLERWHYVEGREHGTYESFHSLNVTGEYRHGVRVGRWTFRRCQWRGPDVIDRSIAAIVDYDDRGQVTSWSSLARDGSQRVAMPILHDDDIVRWIHLEDAWDDAHGKRGERAKALLQSTIDRQLQEAVDAWPADESHRPLAWLKARDTRGAGAPQHGWLDSLLESENDDPRFALIDRLELDHATVEADQLPRITRRASQLVELSLVEAFVLPSIAALFAPGVDWSRLQSLHIDECCDDDDLAAIAAAHLPALRRVTIRHADGDTDILEAAPWRAQLDTFELGDDGEED